MKKIILFSALLSVSTLSFSQGKPEDKDRVRIAKNKVKKTIQWTYKYSQGKPNPKGYITTESQYDEKGNAFEVINYKSNGQISSKLLYKYDKSNNRIEYQKFEKRDKPEMELTYKQTFSYDDRGNKKVEVGFDGMMTYRIVYSYFPDAKPKDIIKYNADNSISEKWEYSYQGNTQTIKVFKSTNLSAIDHALIKKTDSKNNLIEETRFDPKGKEVNRKVYEYDSNSNLISSAEYYSGILSKKLLYTYDKQNQLTEVSQANSDGGKSLDHSYKYDAKGNPIEEKWFDGIPNDLSSKHLKYDNNLNVQEVESYYSDYKYKTLYKYTYEYY